MQSSSKTPAPGYRSPVPRAPAHRVLPQPPSRLELAFRNLVLIA